MTNQVMQGRGSIVVPLDGSAQGAVALVPARTLARAIGAHLELLRVVPEGTSGVDSAERDSARAYLDGIAEELRNGGLDVSTSVVAGDPGTAIVDYVRARSVEAVVMSTHGRSGLPRVMLGSVSQAVLAHSPVPLLLARPGGKRLSQLRTILVPVDGEPGGAVAASTAAALAQRAQARVVLAEVVVPIPLYVYGVMDGGGMVDPAWDDAAKEAADQYVAALASRLKTGGLDVETRVRVGTIVPEIKAVADEVDADLIVMSTHGLTGPARAVLGSVADAVVRTAGHPVLLLRYAPSPETAQEVSLGSTAEAGMTAEAVTAFPA